MKKRTALHLLICYFLMMNISQAQKKKFKRFSYIDGFSLCVPVGLGSVDGELGKLTTLKPIYGVGIEKGVSEKINLGLYLLGGSVEGTENNIYLENFRNDFFQIHLNTYVNLSRLFTDNYKNDKKTEYKFYSGIGLIWFHTDVFDNFGNFRRTTADGTTRHTALFQKAGIGVGDVGIYYTRELLIPLGFRIETKLSKRFNAFLDLEYNFVYNDKFDGTTNYNLLNPNIIGGENSYSNTANDGWIGCRVGVRYKFKSLTLENQRGI
jgi:hypothetical protein